MPIQRLPKGQRWFIERMQTLMQTDKNGICFGLAHMAMQAMLAEDIDTFNKRLNLIYQIPVNQFKEKIEAIESKKIDLFKKVKNTIGSLNDDVKKELEKDNNIQKYLKNLEQIISDSIKEGKLQETARQAEFERRKNEHLFNVLLQKKVEEEILKLSEDERLEIELDIPIFLQNVALYHKAYLYPELFEKDKRPIIQSALPILPLAVSKQLEEQGDISKIDQFSGVYNKDELTKYFNDLIMVIENADPLINWPITFVLSSSNHTITVGYDPKHKQWLFANANQLPILSFKNGELANESLTSFVLNALSKNGTVIFNTEIYASEANKEAVEKCISAWKKQTNWINIHTISPKKTSLYDSYNASWLYVAAKDGDLERVKLLLEKGASPNQARTRDGTTPLYVAAQNGHLEVVKLLLQKVANPNQARTDDGATPLYIAAQNGQLDVVKLLLKKGAKPNLARKDDGATPLYIAAQKGHLEIVRLLLEKGVNPNQARTDNGNGPLHIAAHGGHREIVRLLLEKGANPNQALTSNRATPLLMTAQQGHFEVVKLLLEQGGNPNLSRTSDGATPLYLAAQNGHLEVVKLLLEKGANPNQACIDDGSTPLYMAAQKGHLEIVKLLLEKGANPNQTCSDDGSTPLYMAAENEHLEVIKLLLEKGANPNLACSDDGSTPLISAVQNGNLELVKLLLEKGANPNLSRTSDGATPIYIAEHNKDHEMVKMLLENSAKKRAAPTLNLFNTSSNEKFSQESRQTKKPKLT